MSSLLTVFIIAVSLALDSLAVSVAGGVRVKRVRYKDALKVGVFFGVFQAGMPLIGWMLGYSMSGFVASYSGIIAFSLLLFIGLKMIRSALTNSRDNFSNITHTKTLVLLAIATSIDALVVGITLNLVNVPLMLSLIIIGSVSFILTFAGYILGNRLSTFVPQKIGAVGGVALIAIGLNILFS